MTDRIRTNALLTLIAVATASVLLATSATHAQTTITGNTNIGAHDNWNTASNWSAGVPSGAVDAIVGAGVTAEVWNAATPSYTGNLTLDTGATLQLGWTTSFPQNVNALGGGTVTMNDGTQLRLRLPAPNPLTLPAFNLAGNASIHTSPSTSAHHTTRNFDGAISGPGALTLIGNNNQLLRLNVANTFSGLTLDADDRYRVEANVAGALGIGDVTLNPRANADMRSAVLIINAMDAMDDFATLDLDGQGWAGSGGGSLPGTNYVLQMNADDTIGALFVGGVELAGPNAGPGMFTGGDGSWINGSGILNVTGITERQVQAVPEPASVAVWSLIGLGLVGFGVYRTRRKQ